MEASVRRLDGFGDRVAEVTLVVAPLLAFNVFQLPGIVRLATILLAILLVFIFIRTPGARVPHWELVLTALLALSIMWSDAPNYTSERMRTHLPLVLSAVLAASILPPERILRCVRLAFGVIMASSLLIILFDPDTRARAGSTDLVLTAQFSKNVYGGLLVIALILILERRRPYNFVLVAVLAVLIGYNQSVTAWVTAVFLAAASLASRPIITRLGPRAARPVLAIMVACGLGAIGAFLSADATSALDTVGKDPTLGLRTQIWAASWEQIKLAPGLGHGAFAFLDAASNSPVTQFVWARFQGYQPPHPHNGLIDLAGQLGLAGVVVYAGLVATGIGRGIGPALHGSAPARTSVLCMAFIVIFGVTEPTYLGSWLILMVTFAGMADHRHTSLARAPSTSIPTLPEELMPR